jgi:uncharacterized membrane protein
MTIAAAYEAKRPKAAPVAPVTRVIGSPDSHGRSLAKAVTWRAVGTADTFLWALLVTHHPVAAGTVASLETFTKIFLFYVHERVWRLFKWAPSARMRSLVKSISWRLCGSLDTTFLTFLVTGNIKYAVQVAGAEVFTKIALYYVHERVWRRVSWGRLDAPAAPATASEASAAS